MIKQGFKYRRNLNGGDRVIIDFPSAPATEIPAGGIVVVSSGLAIGGAAAAGAGTVLGVAEEAKVAGQTTVKVDVTPKAVFEVGYIGTTKTSLGAADLWGTLFNLAAESQEINLDDTTGGYFKVVGYNNAKKTAEVLILNRIVM